MMLTEKLWCEKLQIVWSQVFTNLLTFIYIQSNLKIFGSSVSGFGLFYKWQIGIWYLWNIWYIQTHIWTTISKVIAVTYSAWWHLIRAILLCVIYAECHLCRVSFMLNVIYAECYLCWMSFMLSVIYAGCHLCYCWASFILSFQNKPFMLSAIMLNAVISYVMAPIGMCAEVCFKDVKKLTIIILATLN